MKKTRIIYAAALLFAGTTVIAQDFRSGYFLDNFTYGYRLNPSLQPEDTKILFGGLISNIEISPEVNVGVGDFVFVNNGKVVTGLNSAIPATTFPGKLPDRTQENIRINENILSIGWRSQKNESVFNTLEVNLRATESGVLPRTLFEFLKKGGKGNTYNITDMNVRAYGWVEIAYGYSIKNERWDFGGRLKLLIGITSINANIDNMTVAIGNDKTTVSGVGTLYSADSFVKFSSTSDGTINLKTEKGNMKPGGFGAALDLGATWHNDNGLSVSFGFTDLGFLGWNKDGTHASFNSGSVVIDQKTLKDDITKIFAFKKDGEQGGGQSMIPMTANAGIRYHMPFYQGLSVGALGTYRIDGKYSWYEGRAAVTLTPVKQVSINGSYALTSFGSTFGAALSFKVPGANLFVGMDSLPKSITMQGIPVEKVGAMTVNAGLVLAFK